MLALLSRFGVVCAVALALASGAAASPRHITVVDPPAGKPHAHKTWTVTLRITVHGKAYANTHFRPILYIVDKHDALLGTFLGKRVALGKYRVKVVFAHAGKWRYVIPDPIDGKYWIFPAPNVAA